MAIVQKTRSEIKKLFKIERSSIDNYVERGIFKRVGKGKYDLEACIMGFADMKNSQNEKPESLKDAILKKTKLENEKKEMENEKMRGNLVDKQDVDREFFEAGRLIRDNILNVVPKITAELAHETDEKKTALILEKALKNALQTLSDKFINTN